MDSLHAEAWVYRHEDGSLEVGGARAIEDGKPAVKPIGVACIREAELVAATLLNGKAGAEDEVDLFEFITANYALMAITTGIEQSLKTLAEKYANDAFYALKDTFFQNLNDAKNFYKKIPLEIYLTACTERWSLLKDSMAYSHRIRHASGLLASFNTKSPQERLRFVKNEVVELIIAAVAFIEQIENRLAEQANA